MLWRKIEAFGGKVAYRSWRPHIEVPTNPHAGCWLVGPAGEWWLLYRPAELDPFAEVYIDLKYALRECSKEAMKNAVA